MKRLTGACVVSVLCLGGPAAFAQDNAAVDQYEENVPGAGGEVRPHGPRGELPNATHAELESAGPDGQAAALLALATAPPKDPQADRPDLGASGDPGISGLVSNAIGSLGDGMGAALPAILVITLLSAIGLAIARLRSRAGGTAE